MSHLTEDTEGIQLEWNRGEGGSNFRLNVSPYHADEEYPGQASFSLFRTHKWKSTEEADVELVIGGLPSPAVADRLSELFARAAERMRAARDERYAEDPSAVYNEALRYAR